MMPNAIRHSCDAPCSERKDHDGGGAEERGPRKNAILRENHRADEKGQKVIATPHQRTSIQDGDVARMVERQELTGSRIMMPNRAKLVPTRISEKFHQTGRVPTSSTSDEIELSSSRHTSSTSYSLSFSRTLIYNSTIINNIDEQECHSHERSVVCEDMSCRKEDHHHDSSLKKRLTLLISSCHPQQHPSNDDDDTPIVWFEHQQLTLATDSSSLYLADELSSLSDNEENNDHEKQTKPEEPTATSGTRYPLLISSKQDEEMLESSKNLPFLLGQQQSRHKSLMGSEIAAAPVNNRPINCVGLSARNVVQGEDDFCIETRQHQSRTFFHKHDSLFSSLDNHGGRIRKETDHDSSSCLTLSSSWLDTGVPTKKAAYDGNNVAKPQANKHEKDQQNYGQGTHYTNHCNSVTRETSSVPLDIPLKSHLEHHRLHQSSLVASIQEERSSFQQLLLGSKKQPKNTTGTSSATNHHDVDSRAFGKVKLAILGGEDQGRNHGESSVLQVVRRPTGCKTRMMMSQHSTRAKARSHDNKEEVKNSSEKEEEEGVQKTTDQWQTRFQELVEYKTKHGHCNVPFCYNEKPFLAAWVKRQRYQYKCKIRGKHSHLTDERERLLEQLGFVWDSHVAAWEEKFSLMTEFYQQNGHCCVPVKQKELSDWVKRQRRHYKQYALLRKSKLQSATTITASTTISEDRIRRLNEIKFQWAPMTTIQYAAKKKKKDEGASSSPRPKKKKWRSSTSSVASSTSSIDSTKNDKKRQVGSPSLKPFSKF